MAQSVDFFVDGAVFLDVGVAASDVGLWLVVIKVADKIVNGIIWEKVFELVVELGRKRFVVAQYKCWLLHILNDIRHSKGLATASDPE